jgi:hypothetical protein
MIAMATISMQPPNNAAVKSQNVFPLTGNAPGSVEPDVLLDARFRRRLLREDAAGVGVGATGVGATGDGATGDGATGDGATGVTGSESTTVAATGAAFDSSMTIGSGSGSVD